MTRKDYILIADAFRQAKVAKCAGAEDLLSGVCFAAGYISRALAEDNPRFDPDHFSAVVRGDKKLTARPKRARWPAAGQSLQHFRAEAERLQGKRV